MAQEALFNYSKVPPLVRRLRESPIGVPFITFPYKALPAVYKAIERNPLSVLKYEMIFSAIDRASATMRGLDEDGRLAEKRLALKQDRLFSRFIGLPFTDSGGNPYYLDMTYILPWGDLGEMGQFPGVPAALSPGGLAVPLFQLGFNRDFFKKPIYNDALGTTENANRIASHIVRSYMPSIFPGGYSVERLKSAVYGMAQRQTGIPQSVPSAVAHTMFGIKATPVDIDGMRQMQLAVLDHQLEDLDIEFSRKSRDLSRGIITDEEFERSRQALISAQQRLMEKGREIQDLGTKATPKKR